MQRYDKEDIIRDLTKEEFEQLAMEIFYYQAVFNPVYREYLSYLRKDLRTITCIEEIPFIPIDFYKTHRVISEKEEEDPGKTVEWQKEFWSSGTTNSLRSKHYVKDLSWYEESFMKGFERFYGNPRDYAILALLPSYMENPHSSIIYMVDHLIKASGHPRSTFYLDDFVDLESSLAELEAGNQKYILLGVSYALLDFSMQSEFNLSSGIIMETGGMKGRRKEVTREELHEHLSKQLGVRAIHSEYGMSELLSQAWSKGQGRFQTPPWMKVMIRDTYDPFSYVKEGHTGGINVIDLANIYSCSFIETRDLGKMHPDGSFEVLGRFDHAEVRGCNLMVGEA